MDFKEILDRINVDCKDDGKQFVKTDRLDAIDSILQDSEYSCIHQGNLCRLYAAEMIDDESVVLVSVHVDDVYDTHFLKEEGDGIWRGTFDNSITVASVVYEMLEDTLPCNVLVAFTGDEEKNGRGASEVIRYLQNQPYEILGVIVTDASNLGWDSESSFSIENERGLPLLLANQICKGIEDFRYANLYNSEPDETEVYAAADFATLSLCFPVGGELHSNEGCLVHSDAYETYTEALYGVIIAFFLYNDK